MNENNPTMLQMTINRPRNLTGTKDTKTWSEIGLSLFMVLHIFLGFRIEQFFSEKISIFWLLRNLSSTVCARNAHLRVQAHARAWTTCATARVIIMKTFENYALSDSESVYFKPKLSWYLEGFSRQKNTFFWLEYFWRICWKIIIAHFRKYLRKGKAKN